MVLILGLINVGTSPCAVGFDVFCWPCWTLLLVAQAIERWGLCLLQEDHLAKKWGTKDSFQILEELVTQDLKASMVTNQFFREERDERRNLCMETNRKNCHFAFQTNE
jgi:hypothetical protein